MRITRLAAFASTHHGVITLDVARRLGVSERSWYRAIASGWLEPLFPGVARLPGTASTFEQRALAAACAAGPGAVISHRTSVRLWGADRPEEDPIDLILRGRAREATLPGVVVHRPRDLMSLSPMLRSGIPVTNPLRTLVDLGAVDPEGLARAVEQLVVARVVTPGALRAALYRHSKKGRHGVGPLRRVLDGWPLEGLVDSTLEVRMAELLLAHRLPPSEYHPVIEGFEVDFRIIDTPVLLECDGFQFHGLDRDQFEFDRERNAILTAAGWVVVHFTWRQITRSPEAVAARIEANIRRWAPDVLVAHRHVA